MERTFGFPIQLGSNNLGVCSRIHPTKINLRKPIQLVQRRVVHIFVYFPAPLSVSISGHIHITGVSFGLFAIHIGVSSLLENQTKKLTKTCSR